MAGRDIMTYIVLPAYNEEAGLEKLLSNIKPVMDFASLKYQVIVVNDGSKDRTLEIAQRQSGALPIQIINHERNKGLGEALKAGVGKAQEIARHDDIIITMDADNTHPPDLIPMMISKIEDGYDLVIASRFVKGAKEFGLSLHRKALSRGASLLMRTLFPTKNVKDYTCGYRAYRAAIIQKAVAEYGDMFIRERGFNAIVEILLNLRSQSLRACEVPLILHYDWKEGASKMPVLKTILRYVALIAHNLFNTRLRSSEN
jgi:dolichol-phosphate mannosyltransferase